MLYQTSNPHGGDLYGRTVKLDFSVNTNPLGTPLSVVRAVEASARNLCQYPDPCCRELTAALAAYEGVPEDAILCGCGAAELIYGHWGGACPAAVSHIPGVWNGSAGGGGGTGLFSAAGDGPVCFDGGFPGEHTPDRV